MRMETGAYITPTVPYGYVLADCVLTVVESQAKKVRDIFSLYLNGYGVSSITRIMREREDTDMVWKRGLVQYILSNEKYIGDSLMKKSYTPTMLPLRSRKNKGQMPMYYAENTHEAIISKEVFEQVKEIRANRAKKYYIPSEKNPLFFKGKYIAVNAVGRIRNVCATTVSIGLARKEVRSGLSAIRSHIPMRSWKGRLSKCITP